VKSYRAAIIGCGGLGRVHAQCVSEIEGLDVVAFCDVFEEKARELSSEFGGEYTTGDARKVFSDDSIDAVYVVTQHDTHADLCVRAMEAGKDVMVEKPLALTVEDCLRVGEAVERTGRKLMVAFKMRYFDMLLKAKALIPEPIVVTMQMMDNRWPDDAWANDPVKGGGNVLSQGCHSCDILRFAAGRDPVEVYASGGNYYQPSEVVDNLTAVFRFEEGVSGGLVQGDANCPPIPSKFFLQMFDENRSVTLTDRMTTLTYTEAGREPQVFKGSETGFMEENRDFLRCLKEDEHPSIDHVDGLYATLMVLQAFASLESGRPEPIRALISDLVRD
jgi:predicted dehydrogenase